MLEVLYALIKKQFFYLTRNDDTTTTTETPTPSENVGKGTAYDEATQALVDRANAARAEFDAADRVYRDLEREVEDLEKTLEGNYGPGI